MKLSEKRVLVTGATGFVGSHLVKKLVSLGCDVYATTISKNPKSYFYSENLDKEVTLVNLDICDFEKVKDVISKFSINVVFHLAAQPLVDVAYFNPRRTFESNIMGTVNILEAGRLFDLDAIIVASSDKAYGKHGREKYSEDSPLQGTHPYEVSKSATDLISTTYFKTYDLPVVISRFGNIYGEGDLNYSRIIPGIMKSYIENKVLNLRSDGTMVRDYLYVGDVVDGYILLAQNIKKTKGEAYNFGSEETLSVMELIKKVDLSLGMKTNYKIINNQKNEIPYQSLDFSKIKKSLNWKPKMTVKNTMANVFDWYSKTIK